MESKPDTKARASVNCGSGSLLPTGGMWDVGVPPPQCCTAGARRRVVGRRASGGVRPSRRRIAARITRADSPRRLERSGDDKSQPTACGARESSLSRRSLVSVRVLPHFISVMPCRRSGMHMSGSLYTTVPFSSLGTTPPPSLSSSGPRTLSATQEQLIHNDSPILFHGA